MASEPRQYVRVRRVDECANLRSNRVEGIGCHFTETVPAGAQAFDYATQTTSYAGEYSVVVIAFLPLNEIGACGGE